MTSLNATVMSSQYGGSQQSKWQHYLKNSTFRNKRCARKRICHGCEGYIEKSVPRGHSLASRGKPTHTNDRTLYYLPLKCWTSVVVLLCSCVDGFICVGVFFFSFFFFFIMVCSSTLLLLVSKSLRFVIVAFHRYLYLYVWYTKKQTISHNPVRILHKSIAGRYRPVRVADGPIMARYRFMKNANWEIVQKISRNCYNHRT